MVRAGLLLLIAACGSSPPPEPEPDLAAKLRAAGIGERATPRAVPPPADAPQPGSNYRRNSTQEPVYRVPPPEPGRWERELRSCDEPTEQANQDNAIFCALAACHMRDPAKARRHILRMKSPSRRGMAIQTCRKNRVFIRFD